mgnify:CR=1 FL=1
MFSAPSSVTTRISCSRYPPAPGAPSGIVSIGSMLITQMRVMQDLFGTVALNGEQWLACLIPAVALLVLGELFKLVLRARHAH